MSDPVALARAGFQMAQDPNLDQFWGILANKIDARTQLELDDAEANLVTFRQVDLTQNPILGCYDLERLQKIHHFLFQDDIRERGGCLYVRSQVVAGLT